MKRYVLGFAFSPNRNLVLLIWKTHPEWQKGLLNGIGGHIENMETAVESMVREFKEEVDIDTIKDEWIEYAFMSDNKTWECNVFKAFSVPIQIARMVTDEEPAVFNAQDITGESRDDMISNLPFLISLALDKNSPKYTVINY